MTLDEAKAWAILIASVFTGIVAVVNAFKSRAGHAATAEKLEAIHKDVTAGGAKDA